MPPTRRSTKQDLAGIVAFSALLTLMIRRMRHADSAAVTVFNNLGSALLIFPLLFWFGGLSVTPREGMGGPRWMGGPYLKETWSQAKSPQNMRAALARWFPGLLIA